MVRAEDSEAGMITNKCPVQRPYYAIVVPGAAPVGTLVPAGAQVMQVQALMAEHHELREAYDSEHDDSIEWRTMYCIYCGACRPLNEWQMALGSRPEWPE